MTNRTDPPTITITVLSSTNSVTSEIIVSRSDPRSDPYIAPYILKEVEYIKA